MSAIGIFLSNFQLEQQRAFSFVKETVQHLEENCLKLNKQHNLVRNANEENLPLMRRSFSANIFDKKNHLSNHHRTNSHCNEIDSTEPSTGSCSSRLKPAGSFHSKESLENILETKSFQNPTTLSTIASSNDLPTLQSTKESLSKAASLKRLSKNDVVPIEEKSDSPKIKLRRGRMPFFALNIKAIRVASPSSCKDSMTEIASEKEHSPMIQPKKSVFFDGVLGGHSKNNNSINPKENSSIFQKQLVTIPSPAFSNADSEKFFPLELDSHLLEENLFEAIRNIEESSSTRREIFKKILEHIFANKNLDETFHRNHPRKEVIYSLDVEARYFLVSLKSLINALNSEDVKIKMQILDDIQFLSTQHQRFLRILGLTPECAKPIKGKLNVDESEIRSIYDRIVKMSAKLNHKCKSRKNVRDQIHDYQKFLERFPRAYLNSNDRAPLDSSIEVRYITVRKLVEKVTEVMDTPLADKLKHITIFTYDHFMAPLSLLLLLIKKYYTPRPILMTDAEYIHFKQHYSDTRKKRIMEILIFWVDNRPSDFVSNSDLLGLMVTFMDSVVNFEKDNSTKKDFTELFEKVERLIDRSKTKDKKALVRPSSRKVTRTHTLLTSKKKKKDLRLKVVEATSNKGSSDEASKRGSEPNSDKEIFIESPILTRRTVQPVRLSNFRQLRDHSRTSSSESLILEWDITDIAKQLTLIDQKFFKKINISHMMLRRWTKIECKDESKDVHAAIKRFNSLSFWVQYTVIEAQGWTNRLLLLNKFISIAACCLKINNYTTANSIFSALLKLQMNKVWMISKSSEQDWELLHKTFKNEKFFQEMDKVFKNLQPPGVPSISFFTKIFFRLQDNVTFSLKLDLSAKYLKSLQLGQLAEYCILVRRFQNSPYSFPKNEKIYKYLKNGYKKRSDIDFDSEEAEEVIREKILELCLKPNDSKTT